MDVASGELRWSASLAALTGVPADRSPATFDEFLERVHPDDRAELHAAVAATALDGATSQHELRVVWPDGTVHWYDSRWRLVHDDDGVATIVGIARLIDAELGAMERMRFLADVSAALDASLDMDQTLAAVADVCVRDLADWCSIDMTGDDGELRSVAVAHTDPTKAELARRMRERYPPELDGPGGAPNVVRTGEPLVYSQVDQELLARWAVDDEHRDLVHTLDASSALIVPLRARGRVLGAISLVRGRERAPYGDDDVAFVVEVAARAALAVDNARLYGEARGQERSSDEARALLDALVTATPIGLGFLDAQLRFVRVNDALAEITGVPAIDHLGRTAAEVVPHLGEELEGALAQVAAEGQALVDLQLSGCTQREPDRVRHYVVSCYPVALERGERLGIGVAVADVTDRAEAAGALREQRDLYEALMRAQSELGQAFVLLDGERMIYVNAATELLTGRSADELRALPSVLEVMPTEVRPTVAARLVGARAGREPAEPFRTEVLRPDGTRVPIEAAGRRLGGEPADRLVVIARDITERVAQERELQRVLEVEQAARRASEAAHARVRLLADTSALLERSLSSDEALQEVAELLVARVADACTIDVVDLAGGLRRAGADARAPDGRARLLAMAGDARVLRALEAEQATFLDELGGQEDAVLGHSAALVPLVARGRPVGVLSLGWREAGRRPARDEWSLTEALAQRVALAVDGALQYRERAHVAQTLQASLLPAALPRIPGASLAAEYVAAGEGMEVGGDFYDVFALDDGGAWAFVIGDVLGKGAEAAAVTALARYTLRALAARSRSPSVTLATLNDEMLRQNAGRRFVTALLGRLEPRMGGGARLVLASGGHPPPIVLRADGTAEVVPCTGTLLGVEPDAHSSDHELDMAPGDTLVLYTDGVTEARRDRPLTPEALAAALVTSAPEGAGALARAVVQLANDAAGGHLRDDVAALVLALDRAS